MNPAVHPGAREVCNGIDDDCDGLIDEANHDEDDEDSVCEDDDDDGEAARSERREPKIRVDGSRN